MTIRAKNPNQLAIPRRLGRKYLTFGCTIETLYQTRGWGGGGGGRGVGGGGVGVLINITCSSSTSPDGRMVWKNLRSAQVLEKVKVFAWKIANNEIPI